MTCRRRGERCSCSWTDRSSRRLAKMKMTNDHRRRGEKNSARAKRVCSLLFITQTTHEERREQQGGEASIADEVRPPSFRSFWFLLYHLTTLQQYCTYVSFFLNDNHEPSSRPSWRILLFPNQEDRETETDTNTLGYQHHAAFKIEELMLAGRWVGRVWRTKTSTCCQATQCSTWFWANISFAHCY